jgi:hypothetical protein
MSSRVCTGTCGMMSAESAIGAPFTEKATNLRSPPVMAPRGRSLFVGAAAPRAARTSHDPLVSTIARRLRSPAAAAARGMLQSQGDRRYRRPGTGTIRATAGSQHASMTT